jgi:predicted nuclease of predicted toxin-antitoxin system
VRFLLDHDVAAEVSRMLRERHHECWTASAVGLAAASDDALTVWASGHGAVVVSTDREFGQRRTRNAIGLHVWLHCADWEASTVLGAHLNEVVTRLESRSDLTVRVSGHPGVLLAAPASYSR